MTATRSVVLSVLVAAAIGAVGCRPKETPPVGDAARAAGKQPVTTTFARATQREVPTYVDLSGTLGADEESQVATQVAGSVAQVLVDIGSRVKKGDPLVRLDTREASLRAAQAGATVVQARERLAFDAAKVFDPSQVPEVKVAKEAWDLAEQDAQRAKTLVESGAASTATWDNARSRAEQAHAQHSAAVSAARSAYAGMSAASAQAGIAGKQVSDGIVRAPFDGAVAERRVSAGEFAPVGKVVVVVVSDDPLRLKLDVAEEDIAKIAVGRPVEIEVAAFPGTVFQGVVSRVGASLRAQSRTLPIEASLPNADGKLKPGLFARARVATPGQNQKAVFVPASAIGSTGASARVFVKKGNKVEERLVKVGVRADDRVAVTGVAADEEVATSNLAELRDGSDVTGGLPPCNGSHPFRCAAPSSRR